MGKQVNFYMLPEDEQLFLSKVQCNPNVVFLKSASTDQPEIEVVDNLASVTGENGGFMFYIWNRLFEFHSEYIAPHKVKIYDENIPGYIDTGRISYSISTIDAPIIEYSRSFIREGVLREGRIWAEMHPLVNGEFVYKGAEFEKWYDDLAGWLRRNLKRLKERSSYIGAEALKWYQAGGYLE